ncbi:MULTISPECIES: hypothetical protein [unclassified Nocardioides]|uniref:hypothetical protein n=1 Tax=unclassified Nocardioides TaxID=2615069 RepID=UPI0030156AA1
MRPLRAVAALLGLTLAGSLAAGVAPASAADPLYGAPAVDSCHDITMKQSEAATITEAAVACSADHTLATTAVAVLPDSVDLTDFDAVVAAAPCTAARRKAVGKSPLHYALTLYSTFLFVPTAAQQDAGARWVSCHLGVADTQGLNDLPTTLPKLKRKPAASVAKCATDRTYVTCAEKHAYRATTAAYVKARGSDKAVDKKLGVRGPRICSRKVGSTGRWDYHRYSSSKVILICLKKTKK